MIRRMFLLLTCLSLAVTVQARGAGDDYRKALRLYDNGMYDSARTAFEAMGKDPLYEGYAILCAGKMNHSDFYDLLGNYDKEYLRTDLSGRLHYQAALNLFDDQRYGEAADEFTKAPMKELDRGEKTQYLFKRGFCAFALGKYAEAREWFLRLEDCPVSDYTAPSRYAQGFMCYTQENFKEALSWFGKSVKDKRFEDLSNFYIVDCRFVLKDYDYVIEKGVPLYEKMPKSRQAHLSRIISESYLVKGEKAKARELYEKDLSSRREMQNSDYFYAGTLMYSTGDYKGAIENFTQMTERSDSLWQIAAYQLGNCYIQQRNKVEAMESFAQAAALDYDDAIREDASFNHAKLAFDINNDGSFFEEYLKLYNTTRKGEQIYGYMGLARLVNRDYAGAIDAYDKISSPDSEQDRNCLKANYLRAVELVRSGAYTDAVPYLKAATFGLSAHDNFCQLSKYWLAECSYRAGDYKTASSLFANLYNISALDGKPEGYRIPYNMAYSIFRTGDYANAAKWFNRYLLEGDGECRADALVRRADCEFALKDYKSAVESYGKAADAYGDSVSIYPFYQKALACGLGGDNAGKAAMLREVGSRFPSDAVMYSSSLYELGRTLLDMKENEEAVRTFGKLREITRDVNTIDRSLLGEGMANVNMKNYEKAISCYKEVISHQGTSEIGKSALAALESVYGTMKRPQDYVAYLESSGVAAGKSESERDRLYFNAAKQSFLAGDYGQAEKSFDEYIKDFPSGANISEAWYYMGECYGRRGEKESARSAFANAIDIPGEGSFKEMSVRNFARISLEIQRYDDAYSAYSHLLETTAFEELRTESRRGMMLSAYKLKDYRRAIMNAEALGGDCEALYIKAKSCLSISRRDDAVAVLKKLAEKPSTAYGAEATYLLIQDAFDRGNFAGISDMVYDFAPKAGDQNYWLARCFVTLGDSFVELGNTGQASATYESLLGGYSPSGEGDDIHTLVYERMEHLKTLKK